MPKTAAGHGPKAAIDKAVAKLSDIIIKGEIQKNNYVSLAFPRFLYKIVGQMRWRKLIKANGGKAKDLGKNILSKTNGYFKQVSYQSLPLFRRTVKILF